MCKAQTMAATQQLFQTPRRPTFDFTSRWITCTAEQQQLRLFADSPLLWFWCTSSTSSPTTLPVGQRLMSSSPTADAVPTAYKPNSRCSTHCL